MPYFAVAVGGFIGAVIRYTLGEWIGTLHGFPLATLIINVTGSFVLVWFYTITLERLPIHPHIRLGIGTGLIGAFTTFSSFSVETWALISGGMYVQAALYVILTFALGPAAGILGAVLAQRQARLRFVDNAKEV